MIRRRPDMIVLSVFSPSSLPLFSPIVAGIYALLNTYTSATAIREPSLKADMGSPG
jgi:hypothetical protein